MSVTKGRGNPHSAGTPAGWVEPELATLTHERFSGPGWLYERKFDEAAPASLRRSPGGMERQRPASDRGALPKSAVHWVEPKLVSQIAFTEWTGAGQLRHPRYLGLRRDKDPAAVTREVAR
jgi:bifunctional non-homologous end joining protein LigD